MKQQFSTMNMMSQNASSVNACFAAAICLIMMDAISVVSIILLLGIVSIGFIIIALLPDFCAIKVESARWLSVTRECVYLSGRVLSTAAGFCISSYYRLQMKGENEK